MIRPYSVFLRIDTIEALRERRQRDRDGVFRFARSLAENPFQASDYREHDSRGRSREIKIIGDLAIVYHVDNAEQEIRILDVRSAKA
jgi:mRNA-degrading endonuclease YafQ of YafQ-DinJ toxin-antitoxin module